MQRFLWKSHAASQRFVYVSLLFLLAASAGADMRGVGLRAISVTAHNGFETTRLTDGPTAQDELRALAGRATLPGLRWPDYSDYLPQVQRFYEPTGYAPAWIENTRPTPQAQAMITVLEQADTKGLDPDDYDATRWPVRIEKLRQSPAAADLAHFDLALTISVMRYISDLHLGKSIPVISTSDLTLSTTSTTCPILFVSDS